MKIIHGHSIFVTMLRKLFFIAIVALTANSAFAQAGFDDDVQDVAVPVDGGISLVIAGAIAYGISHTKQKNNR